MMFDTPTLVNITMSCECVLVTWQPNSDGFNTITSIKPELII